MFRCRLAGFYQSTNRTQVLSRSADVSSAMPRRKIDPPQRLSEFGAWLRFLRRDAGYSQVRLSVATDIPQPTISSWETKGDLPGRTQILALCRVLEVSPNTLLRYTEDR